MTRIRHDRPPLRLADNLARELHRFGFQDELRGRANATPPPSLPNSTVDGMVDFLAACAEVVEAESAWLGKFIGPKKVRVDSAAALAAARQARDTAADAIVLAATKLSGAERRNLSRWIKWLETEAIQSKRIILLDILFEDGLKPAFTRAVAG